MQISPVFLFILLKFTILAVSTGDNPWRVINPRSILENPDVQPRFFEFPRIDLGDILNSILDKLDKFGILDRIFPNGLPNFIPGNNQGKTRNLHEIKVMLSRVVQKCRCFQLQGSSIIVIIIQKTTYALKTPHIVPRPTGHISQFLLWLVTG